jgi:superfamily II DNA or RNA helicase
MKTIRLRDIQNEAVDHLLSEEAQRARWAALVMPTGQGKTAVLTAAVGAAIADGSVRGAVFLTPMVHIEDAFERAVTFTYAPEGKAVRKVVVDDGFWVRPRNEAAPVTETIREYLRDPKGVLLSTHAQTWRLLAAAVLPDDLTGVVLALDEAHHTGAEDDRRDGTWCDRFAKAWHARGGTVWQVTATMEREDKLRIHPDDVVPFRVSYVRAANEGFAPRSIRLRTVESVVIDRPPNELQPADCERIAALVRTEGRPTVIRVPAKDAEEMARMVTASLVDAGYSADEIVDAVGKDDYIKADVRDMLDRERDLPYAKTQTRVVVACRRMSEGADWPHCSHVVSIGAPTSLPAFVQLVGRALRGKRDIKGYPKAWVDETLVTLVIPKLPEGSAGWREQVERLLLFACALDCNDVVYDYLDFWAGLVKNFRLPPTVRKSRVAGMMLSDEERRDATARMVELVGAARLGGKPVTLGRVLKLAHASGDPELLRAVTASLVGREELAPAVREATQNALEAAAAAVATEERQERAERAFRVAFDNALQGSLINIADKYQDLALDVDLRIARAVEGVLTPQRVGEIAADLRARRDALYNLSDVDVLKVIDAYRAKYGRAPSLVEGEQDASEFVGFSFQLRDLDRTLRRSGLDLARFVTIPRSWVVGPDLDLDAIRARRILPARPELWETPHAIRKARDQRGLKVRIGKLDEHVLGITLAAERGWRGLVKGTDLRTGKAA